MQALLALAFLALARAAFIDVPKTIIGGDLGKTFMDRSLDEMAFGHAHVDPIWTAKMFEKYGLVKPLNDDFTTWGKSIGIDDPWMLHSMRSAYEKPALMFFKDPAGRVISFYAHEGIDKSTIIPDMRSAFTGLAGASDKLAIGFDPESMLSHHYKSVLPGHFFEPVKDFRLNHFLNDMPITSDFVSFKPNILSKGLWNKFDIDTLPYIYKDPVSLDIDKKYFDDAVVPMSHVSPFTSAGFVPFVKSSMFHGASPFVAESPFGFRSGLGVSPAVKSAAFHLVKADMPYFTAAPAAGFVDAGIPLVKTAASSSPLFIAEPTGFTSSGLTPVHAIAAAPPGIHYAPAPIHSSSPLFASFAKSAVPCINCLGAEHSFAPAGTIPLVKTFGDVGLTHFGAAGALRSAFPGMVTGPVAASSLIADPAVGLTGFPSGLTGFNTIPTWKKL